VFAEEAQMSDNPESNGIASLQTSIKEVADDLELSSPIGPTPLAADALQSPRAAPSGRRPRHRWVVPPPA
jgi:hypothetical protein